MGNLRGCARALDLLRSLGYSWEEICRMLGRGNPGPPEWSQLVSDALVPGWSDLQEQLDREGIPRTPEGLRQWLSRARRASLR
jgi:hypothetical protein